MFQKYFSTKRFNNAIRHDLKHHAKTYLSFLIGLFLVLIFIHLININVSSYRGALSPYDYSPIFYFAFIISVIVVVGTSFPLLKNKKSAITYLMLPASVFEKCLIQFIIRILCFSILFIILFWLDFKIANSISTSFKWGLHKQVDHFGFFEPFKKLEFGIIHTSTNLIVVIGCLFTLITFVFAGATFFKKYTLFKTILSFSGVITAYFLFFMVCKMCFFPDMSYPETYLIDSEFENDELFFCVLTVVPSLFLLPLAYFKLKEKEL